VTALTATAPAKLNLALHVTGQRADGYHLLDSLVCFAAVGDRLTLGSAASRGLTVSGPFAAGVPTGPENLIWKAAALFGDDATFAISLEKNLPHAAGLGGGSADAAACLRLMARHLQRPLPDMAEILTMGADVPVCLRGAPVRMSGIGEVLSPVPPLPPLACVLVNPGVAMPTGPVFAGLARKDNPPMTEMVWSDGAGFFDWLGAQRNDLEPPARALSPEIGAALSALKDAPACRLARMSGSGATCFGLFASREAAVAAAVGIAASQPDWWVRAADILDAGVGDQTSRATT
jgi:4-diphosphocytidyl-2-C-methyl-D-erythritol kinase